MRFILFYSAYYVNIFAVILYFFLHIVFSFGGNANSCQIEYSYPIWVNVWVFAELVGFYSNFVLNLIRALSLPKNAYKSNFLVIYGTVLVISLLAGTSSLFQYVYPWTRLCSDEYE